MARRDNVAFMIRLNPENAELLRRACDDLGMRPATYIQTIVAKELSAAYPKDQQGKVFLADQIAEIAGQVIRHMSKGDEIREKHRKK